MIPSRRVSFFGTGSDRLNDTVVNTVRHLFRRGWPRGFFLSGMLLPLLFGCIREDRSDCFPVAETRFVVLKIVDEATGQDITQTGEAGSAVLYLFSQGGRFVDRISVTRRYARPLPCRCLGQCRNGPAVPFSRGRKPDRRPGRFADRRGRYVSSYAGRSVFRAGPTRPDRGSRLRRDHVDP